MDDAVPLGHCGLGEVVVEELNSIRVAKGFGDSIHHIEATVVVEGGANVEAFAAAEVPRLVAAWLGVDDDRAA